MRASKEAKVVGMKKVKSVAGDEVRGAVGGSENSGAGVYCSLMCKCHSHMRTCTDVLQYVGSGGTLNRAI